MLIREGHLGNVLAKLLASYDFHVCSAYIVGDVIFVDLRQPPSLLRVFGGDMGWTPMGSRLLSTPKRRSGWAPTRGSSLLSTREQCQYGILPNPRA